MTGDHQKTLLIRDLVEVPEIKTVIQLQDLNDPGLRRMIAETFVITGEVASGLKSVFASLCSHEGRGIFLKGHFGSGKSHFLSMLSLLARHPESWDQIVMQEPSLEDFATRLRPSRLMVAEISLVQHRGSEFLEDIFLRAIFRELGRLLGRPFEGAETRQETFLQIKAALSQAGFAGMVLLVDELSEFLRSKPDARTYNEDIRFLQYLGEESSSFPLWVVASLQEWIEETGEIHQDTFNKIKDRYRIRLNLGRAHIEELVSQRLIRHRDGAEARIGEIFESLKAYFPTFPVTLERFTRLYPVHPATSTLLDRLKPLFSEHRGVVDFIHYRLKGDPERHIPSLLDRPAHELLTPEVIFDHFLDRIRERSESQIYVERVFAAYQDQIPEIFQDPDQRHMAVAAVKLLILFAISPVKFKYVVRHMAEMVLFRVTPMEAEINYEFFGDILERLAKEGSYIQVEKADEPLKSHYFIDLRADMAGIMRRRIRHMASELFAEDRRLFTKLAAMAHSSHLPLRGWVEQGRQKVPVEWQHTRRTGILFLRQLDEVSDSELEGLARQWARSEEDVYLFVGTTHDCDSQYRHMHRNLLPLVRERYPGMFLFWIPAPPPERDLSWLKEMLAAVLMLEQTERERSDTSERARDYLQGLLEKERSKLAELFTHAYFQGAILWDEKRVELSTFGYLSQGRFLHEFVPPLLQRRYPKHGRVQPYMDALAPSLLKDMLKDFFSTGMLQVDDRSKFPVRDVLEGLLKPMGLIKKKGNQYLLQVDPRRNELAQAFFQEMGERETLSLDDLYWAFRKGPYGLLMPQFEILVMALLFSGHLVAYHGMKRKGLDETARSGLKGITALGKGEILGEELRQHIASHPLVPERFRKIPLTLASQEELWSEVRSTKPAAVEDLQAILSRIEWATSFPAFKDLAWEPIQKDIRDLISQWDEVKVSLASREGLERFLRAAHGEPFLAKKLDAAKQAKAFLEHADRALFVYQYVIDPRLHIPEQQGWASISRLRGEILQFYQDRSAPVSAAALEALFQKFQRFQQDYLRAYVDAHHRARGGKQFEPYEKLTRSKRYDLLRRLDHLEMISVQHNRRSIDQGLSTVLLYRCLKSPQDHLQTQPVCSCGFQPGESTSFRPVREVEREIDMGIVETMEMLQSPAVQEKLLPYLEGLDLVGKKEEAGAIRQLLKLTISEGEEFFDRVNQAVTPRVVQGINEAFRGKVVVVQRDLDQLYQSLVHRRYTLARTRKILSEWLKEKEVAQDTFLHFIGRGEDEPADHAEKGFRAFLQEEFYHLVPLFREVRHTDFVRAMLASLWADQYDIAREKIFEIFPFLQRGAEIDARRRIADLSELGHAFRSKRPELFEALVRAAEEDTSFTQALWSQLSSISPVDVFGKESIFPAILREAFERLLGTDVKGEGLGEDDGKPVAGTTLLERREEMVRALENYHTFRQKCTLLKKPKISGPAAFHRWESVFIRAMSPIPSLCEELYARLERIGTPVPPFLRNEKREGVKKMDNLARDFSEFYQNALPVWEKEGEERPTMIQDIPFLLSRKRGVPDHARHHYLFMDGMRWDLWEVIKVNFFGKMADRFRVVREGPLWAHQPTDTSTQLAYLEQAFQAAYPDGQAEELLWKISGIDERIHTEKGSLEFLFANVVRYLELDLAFRLTNLRPRTLLIIFSDHGFVENKSFSRTDKYEAPRYLHGKDSPFEVIVPWAWVMRI